MKQVSFKVKNSVPQWILETPGVTKMTRVFPEKSDDLGRLYVLDVNENLVNVFNLIMLMQMDSEVEEAWLAAERSPC